MGEWLSLNQASLYNPRKELLKGVEVEVQRSPLDLPVAIKADFDRESGVLSLHFRYLTEDLSSATRREDDLRVTVGESGRILAIESRFDADLETPEGSQRVLDAILSALEKAGTWKRSLAHRSVVPRKSNLQAAQELVSAGSSRIVDSIRRQSPVAAAVS